MFQHFTYCGCQDESFELFNSFTAEKTTVNVTQQTQQSTEAGIATVCLSVYILPKIRPSKLIMEQQWRQNGNWTYSTMSMSLYLHKHFYTSPFPKKHFSIQIELCGIFIAWMICTTDHSWITSTTCTMDHSYHPVMGKSQSWVDLNRDWIASRDSIWPLRIRFSSLWFEIWFDLGLLDIRFSVWRFGTKSYGNEPGAVADMRVSVTADHKWPTRNILELYFVRWLSPPFIAWQQSTSAFEQLMMTNLMIFVAVGYTVIVSKEEIWSRFEIWVIKIWDLGFLEIWDLACEIRFGICPSLIPSLDDSYHICLHALVIFSHQMTGIFQMPVCVRHICEK